MSNQQEDFGETLKGVEAALRRAAQTAKRLAEQNGTPYVVAESQADNQLQEHTAHYTSLMRPTRAQ